MSKKAKSVLPIAPLPDLMRRWQSQATRGLLIGGLAVSLLGRPRMTRDVDVMVLEPAEHWPAFLSGGLAFGFVPRYGDTPAFAQARRKRGKPK